MNTPKHEHIWIELGDKYKLPSDLIEFWTLANMRKFGGSFVKILVELYWAGDTRNKLILTHAFEHYFLEYSSTGIEDAQAELNGKKRGWNE